MAPGARTPTHKHAYPRYVYVLEGILTVVDEATGQAFEVKRGGFLAEMVDTWHHGENRGKVAVRLIAVDQVPEGTTGNTILKPEQ
jgi:quercetin dioxygenase-like cupin family protein